MSETIEQRAHGIVMQGYLIESLAPHRLGELEKDIETAIRNALAAESEQADTLAGWLLRVINAEFEKSELIQIEDALSDWRTARGRNDKTKNQDRTDARPT